MLPCSCWSQSYLLDTPVAGSVVLKQACGCQVTSGRLVLLQIVADSKCGSKDNALQGRSHTASELNCKGDPPSAQHARDYHCHLVGEASDKSCTEPKLHGRDNIQETPMHRFAEDDGGLFSSCGTIQGCTYGWVHRQESSSTWILSLSLSSGLRCSMNHCVTAPTLGAVGEKADDVSNLEDSLQEWKQSPLEGRGHSKAQVSKESTTPCLQACAPCRCAGICGTRHEAGVYQSAAWGGHSTRPRPAHRRCSECGEKPAARLLSPPRQSHDAPCR